MFGQPMNKQKPTDKNHKDFLHSFYRELLNGEWSLYCHLLDSFSTKKIIGRAAFFMNWIIVTRLLGK